MKRKKPIKSETERNTLDFAPFDSLANLEAVCEAVKTIRHLSWSYAGDIARVAVKIGQTFYAGRCVVCVCREDGFIEVFEYTDGSVPSAAGYLASAEGQAFLGSCLELAPDWVHLGGVSGLTGEVATERASLENPGSYVFPLRHQYEKRHVVKPGLLLLQEPNGLTRWNRHFLDSVLVVAEYLAMVIECERLYGLVNSPRPGQ